MPYTTTHHRLTPKGSFVTVTNETHYPVLIVQNDKGVLHSVHVDGLSDEPVADEHAEIVTKVRQSTKTLTQAEKIQLEYLKSIGK